MTDCGVLQRRTQYILSLAAVICLALSALGQTDPIDEQGLKPFGSYHGGDIDVVNLMNGKLDLHIPVVSYPQRGGKLNMSFTLRYNNPITVVNQICDPNCHEITTFVGLGVQVLPDFQMSFTGYVANNKNVNELVLVDGSTHELGTTSGTVSESLDGTGWRYDSGPDVVTDRYGTQYQGAATKPQISLEDSNGNRITGTSSAWTDTLGRSIPVLPGTATSDYSGCTGTQTTASANNWVVPGPNGGSSTYKLCYAGFGVSAPPWLQSLVLPNGQAWTFEYDTNGNLSTITLPTGGTISYAWTTSSLCASTGYPKRSYSGVSSRTVNANDGTGAHTWTYNLDGGHSQGCPGALNSTVTDPLGNYSSYYFGTLAPSEFYEIQKTDYDAAGNTIQSTLTSYISSTDENGPQPGNVGVNNVLASEIDTYSYSGTSYRMKGVKKTYDQNSISYAGVWGQGYASYGNLLSEAEYDYGTGTGLGPLIRTTNTTYVTSSAYTNYNLVSLPASVTVLDAGSTQVANTSYGYDSPGIQGGPYGTSRGNQTSANRWLNTTNTYLTSSKVYNSTGTVASSTDPGNHTTSYTYDSTGTYVIQTNFPDTNSPNLAHHVTHATYDSNTGLPLTHKDENLNTTTYGYDAMWRIQTVTYPAGGGVDTFTYDDTPPSLSVELKHTIDGSRSTNEYVIFDQLGREISRSKANDESVPWDKTDTCYDARGLKSFVSYPYQASAYNSAQSCAGAGDSYLYDALNRTTSVTHSDGTSIVTAYSGAANSVTDEGNGTAATQKVSQVDGLGRLISVCEVTSTTLVGISPAPGACGQTIAATGFLTSYQYDVLGNLQTVTQGGLNTRSFTYDSLSRLLSASNPESGTTSYSYDSDGNVLSRTRPAPNQTNAGTTVTTTYSPDALHRTTAITYSDGTTPSSTFQYDQGSVSNQSPQNPSGRLTYETSANGTAGAVFSYDTMGRVLNEWECTPQNCGAGGSFPVAFSYDLAGGLTSLNNGVGTTFTYGPLNRAQRPTTVTSNYIQNGNPGTMFSALHYNAFGSELSASIGNGGSEVYGYDPRGRLGSFTATAPGGVVQPATPGTGSVTISGSEKSANNPATPSTGTVTVTGTEQSMQTNPCEQEGLGSCPITWYDYGYVQVTVDGYAAKYNYGQNDTDGTIETGLNTLLNASSSPVTSAIVSGKLTLTSKATGTNTNYPLSITSATSDPTHFNGPSFGGTLSGGTLTGGTNSSTTYDAGTVSITVNGTLHATANYGSTSTTTSVASALASALNGSLVTATASGAVVHITSVDTGQDTNYTLSATSQSGNPSRFNPPSFTTSTSGSTLTGGTNSHDTSGAAYTLSVGYSGNSNIISAQDSVNGNWTYTYDPMNRLVTSACAGNATAHCPDGTATQGYNYVYDRFGNRWQQNLASGSGPGPAPQYSFDANNHMIGASYDAAGNMLNDGFHTYIYDAENRIIKVDTGDTAVYTYDAEGRRVRKVAGSTVDYVYDHAGRQIAEVNASGSWNREEVYVGGRHLATYSGTTTYFHDADWLGTERVRTDVNGNIYETCQSLPYGDELGCTGGDPSPMHFTGKQRDTETNLDDFPARYYSSVQGRWLSPDWDDKPVSVPYAILGNPQTLNLYSYVGGDPTNHADPDGHMNLNALSTANTASWEDYYEDQRGQAGSVLHDTAQNKPQYDPKKSGPEDPTNPGHPLSQNSVYKKASDDAWQKTMNGTARNGRAEAGGTIEYKDGKIYPANQVNSVNGDAETANHLQITTDANTIAIYHTHGNSLDPRPSPGDRSPNTQVPDFVRSQRSLYVTIPGTAHGNPSLNDYIELQ